MGKAVAANRSARGGRAPSHAARKPAVPYRARHRQSPDWTDSSAVAMRAVLLADVQEHKHRTLPLAAKALLSSAHYRDSVLLRMRPSLGPRDRRQQRR